MTASFSPRSPQVLKGALAIYEDDAPGTQPVVVPFQYNPHQVRRTLANRRPQQQGGGQQQSAPEDVRRVGGPPVETINMTVEMTAADQLANPDNNQLVAEQGLHPALAALEMLLYPPSFRFEENKRRAEQGETEFAPASLPLALLVWGKSRVVPVLVTSFSVTEEEFAPDLNPTRAKVELGLRVLTIMEMPEGGIGLDVFLAYQKRKEKLARDNQSINPAESRTTDLLPE